MIIFSVRGDFKPLDSTEFLIHRWRQAREYKSGTLVLLLGRENPNEEMSLIQKRLEQLAENTGMNFFMSETHLEPKKSS